ncbi:MAG: hypothetical protein AB8H79_12625 [Myxococcota bacterium]
MIALWLSLCSPAAAVDTDGFAEVRVQAYTGVEGAPVAVIERFRPTFSADLSDRISLSSTLELGLNQGWRADVRARRLLEDANVLAPSEEPSNPILRIDELSDYLYVDRLYVDAYTKYADIRVGRQALNWGSGFVVNPSDPFPQVLLTEPWKPRQGVNAVRATIPLGGLSRVQLVGASDDAFVHPRVAGRVTVNALDTDFSAVGAYREEANNGIVGLDIKGTLGVGFWVEGVVHIGEGTPYEEVAIGADYSFNVLNGLFVTAQYYRNGNEPGVTGPSALFAEREDPFAPFFSGRDYLMLSGNLAIVPEASTSVLAIQNLGDGTAFIVPTVGVYPSAKFDITLAAQIPLSTWGDGGEFRPSPQTLQATLPTLDGGTTDVDLNGISPSSTLILWLRYNY